MDAGRGPKPAVDGAARNGAALPPGRGPQARVTGTQPPTGPSRLPVPGRSATWDGGAPPGLPSRVGRARPVAPDAPSVRLGAASGIVMELALHGGALTGDVALPNDPAGVRHTLAFARTGLGVHTAEVDLPDGQVLTVKVDGAAVSVQRHARSLDPPTRALVPVEPLKLLSDDAGLRGLAHRLVREDLLHLSRVAAERPGTTPTQRAALRALADVEHAQRSDVATLVELIAAHPDMTTRDVAEVPFLAAVAGTGALTVDAAFVRLRNNAAALTTGLAPGPARKILQLALRRAFVHNPDLLDVLALLSAVHGARIAQRDGASDARAAAQCAVRGARQAFAWANSRDGITDDVAAAFAERAIEAACAQLPATHPACAAAAAVDAEAPPLARQALRVGALLRALRAPAGEAREQPSAAGLPDVPRSALFAGVGVACFESAPPTRLPDWHDALQGAVGDCYLAGGAGAVVMKDPAALVEHAAVDASDLRFYVDGSDALLFGGPDVRVGDAPAPMLFAQLERALAHRRGAGGSYAALMSGTPVEAWRALVGPRLVASHVQELADIAEPAGLLDTLRQVEADGLLCTFGTGQATPLLAEQRLASSHIYLFSRLRTDDAGDVVVELINLQRPQRSAADGTQAPSAFSRAAFEQILATPRQRDDAAPVHLGVLSLPPAVCHRAFLTLWTGRVAARP